MSFVNDCCREQRVGLDPSTGERATCETCGNEFIYTGERWANVLDIGRAKVDKLERIARVNSFVRLNERDEQPPF